MILLERALLALADGERLDADDARWWRYRPVDVLEIAALITSDRVNYGQIDPLTTLFILCGGVGDAHAN